MEQSTELTKQDELVIKLTGDFLSVMNKIETQLNLNKEEEEDMLRVQRVVLAVFDNHRENSIKIEQHFDKEFQKK